MSTQPSLNPSFGGQTLSEGTINTNNQSEGVVTATQPQPPCERHPDRPSYRVGLCRDCFDGKPTNVKELRGGSPNKYNSLEAIQKELAEMRTEGFFAIRQQLREIRRELAGVRAAQRGAKLKESVKKLTPNVVIDAVVEEWETTHEQLFGHSRAQDCAVPRSVAMYLVRSMIGMSYPSIGRMMGGYHHSSCIHAVKRIAERMQTDERLSERVKRIERHFLGTVGVQ